MSLYILGGLSSINIDLFYLMHIYCIYCVNCDVSYTGQNKIYKKFVIFQYRYAMYNYIVKM